MDLSSAPVSPLVRKWLWSLWIFILVMIALGGAVRLSGSGLSMTEWHPVMGWLPPLTSEAWESQFHAYQQSPQYEWLNPGMDLQGFKGIFWMEYLHRLAGRVMALWLILPGLWFFRKKSLTPKLVSGLLLLLILGGIQGFLGWAMVKSGLLNRPSVSHFRLAIHLLMAFGTGQVLIFMLAQSSKPIALVAKKSAWIALNLLQPLLILQIVYGAFMAGTKAGWMAATFPDMAGHYLPFAFNDGTSLPSQLVNNPLIIHWIHRFLGIALSLMCLHTAGVWSRVQLTPAILIGIVAILQSGSGIYAALFGVPMHMGVFHQVSAYILLSLTCWLRFRK